MKFFLLFPFTLDLPVKQNCVLLKLPFPFICSSKYVQESVFICPNNMALPARPAEVELSFHRYSVTGAAMTQVSALPRWGLWPGLSWGKGRRTKPYRDSMTFTTTSSWNLEIPSGEYPSGALFPASAGQEDPDTGRQHF